MGKKQYDISKQKTSRLDAEFVKNENTKPKAKPVSFFQMFKYSTKTDKFLIFIGVFFSIATGIIQPLNTVLFGGLAGDAIQYSQSISSNSNMTQKERNDADETFFYGIRHFALMNTLIGIGMFVFSYFSTVTFNYTAMKQTFKIRSNYLKAILNQDISWYDQNQTGDFASRMSDDLYKLEDGIGEKVPMFLHLQVLFVTAIIIALVKGWELALISLVSVPASVISFTFINLLTTKLAKNEMEAYGASGSIAEEVFSLIRTVTAFGGQQKEIERYKKNLIVAKNNNIKRSLLNGIGFGLLYLLIYSSYGLAFWYGVKLVLEERDDPNATYTPGNMVTVFFSVMQASMNFGSASPFLEVFGIAKAAAQKIFSVIENEPIINLSKDCGDKLDNFKGNVKFNNVKFHYPSRPDVPILQGLNIEIKPGDTVALVGSSGCGKSTVIQLIQRFYDAISGEVLLDSTNIKNLDLTWYRSKIGVVGQEPVLFGTSIMENIKYGKYDVTENEVIAAAKKANAHNFIKSLPNGYNTLVGERGTQLSGGQKQRIAIARALVRKPILMLLDEATSALDNASEAKVQEALDLASVDCTTIIVAHRLSTIRGANKIIVLSEGVVVEEGTHEELMELKNEYFKLVTAQVTYNEDVERIKKTSVAKDEIEEVNVDNDDLKEEDKESDDFKSDKNVSIFAIMKMNSPEWPYIFIASIGSVVVGCGLPIFAVIFGSILGTLADGDEDYIRSQTNFYCVAFVVAGGVCMISVFLQNYLLGIAGEKLTERIRTQLFTALVSQEISFFDKKANGVGALCAKLSGDAASIQGATGQRVGAILQNIATFGLAIGLSLYYQWKLGLVTAAFAPLIITAIFIERRNTSGRNDIRDTSLQKSTKIAVEAVGNIRTVAGLVLEETFLKSYTAELIPHYKSSLKLVHGRAIVFGLSRSLTFFAYATAMYYGGFLVRDGMYYDKMFKVAQAQMMGVVSIANSLAFSPNLSRGISSAKKVKTFLSKLPLIRDHPDAKIVQEVNGDISYSAIEFSYPTRPNTQILKGLNLNVLNGKTVALVGESGCGKSTIIQMIERFYDPNSGEVTLDNDNIKNISLSSLRSHLGIVSQEPNLFNKTIAENIAYGDNSRNVPISEIIQVAKDANIHNFIAGLPQIAVEAVGNIRTVAGLVLEETFLKSYTAELIPHYKSSLKLVHGRAIVFGLSRSLTFFAYATAMYYGGFLVRDGMYYDKMFKVAQAQMMGVVSIANSLAFSPNLSRGISSAKKVKTFLSKLPLIRDHPDAKIVQEVNGDISYSAIEFSYPTRPNTQILKGLNLNVLNGKTVALVGESGCGKSTIIQMIERFYDPNSGEVTLDNDNIKNISLSSLRSHLGIVSQEPNLFNKTIAENIAYGDNSRNVPISEIIQVAKDANIHNFIAGLPQGYETKLGEKAVQLSGGQKQRIAIARALVRNPKVLLLDEATSALDTESEKVVQEALDQAKKGRTCITIAHRLTTIQDADLICVINEGVVAESGTHKELLEQKGMYHKLYTQKH